MKRSACARLGLILLVATVAWSAASLATPTDTLRASADTSHGVAAASVPSTDTHGASNGDMWSLVFVFLLATFIGLGVVAKVSRLLHTPLMSLTNAISAIAVVGAIIVVGSDYPQEYRILGAIALFASMTNIVSGFLITDRMLKMFKETRKGGQQ